MRSSLSRRATSLLVVAAMLLIAGRCWAVFVPLGPSQDDWGMKYDVKMAADGDKVNVYFKLADEGRLKPVYTVTLVAFSDPDYDGSRTYLAQNPLTMKANKDGSLVGQAQISKEHIGRAQIRILTLSVDGKRQNVAASYYIPLKRYLTKAPAAASTSASQSMVPTPAATGPVSR
jgi:hypothetical protein